MSYIRTNQGINKIMRENENYYVLENYIVNKWDIETREIKKEELDTYVNKSSTNLIDVIKEGDFVNGQKVLAIDSEKRIIHTIVKDMPIEEVNTILTGRQYYDNCFYK